MRQSLITANLEKGLRISFEDLCEHINFADNFHSSIYYKSFVLYIGPQKKK